MKSIGLRGNSLSVYFYSSFLANFTEYLVPVNEGKNIQVPMQRSGSCVLASIMDSLLYESKDEKTFYLYRNKIGNKLITQIINDGETNIEFIRVITDGFDINGRAFLKGLLSSMAHNVLKYLETGMPKEFKHAGLIGSGRSSWLYENKEKAVVALKNNKEALKLISETIKSSNVIIKFLDHHRIRHNSTRVEVKASNLANLNLKYASKSDDQLNLSLKTNSLRSNVNEFIKGLPERPKLNIVTFKDFKDAFAVVESKLNSSKLMFLTMDIFRANENWPNIIKSERRGRELLSLQESVIKIVKSFVISTSRTSFDDFVTLLLLQQLVWQCTVLYNDLAPSKSKICKPSFKLDDLVPKTLGHIFHKYSEKYRCLLSDTLNWRFHNVFDPKCIDIFISIMKDYISKQGQNGSKDKYFTGPEDFLNPESRHVKFEDIKPEEAINIYDHEIVLETWKKLKDEERNDLDKIWSISKENVAKAKIVHFHAKDKLKLIFPHYYNLMDALAIIQIAAIEKLDAKTDLKFWIYSESKNSYQSKYTNFYAGYSAELSYYIKSPISIMRYTWSLPTPYKEMCYPPSIKDIFYRFKHSAVLFGSVTKSSYQVWLNYIKDANNAKIFDSVYFQYVTDHLLNNPTNFLDSYYDYSSHFWNLDSALAVEIIDAMINLISSSLLSLHEDNLRPLTMERRRALVLRAANISILVTRFISQLDFQKKLHGNFCARKLAQIYDIMHSYSYLVSNYKLTSIEVSYINFSMFFVCSITIRNNREFMKRLTCYRNVSVKVYRKTLEKFHWFIANTNFSTKGALMGIISDQFN